MRIGVVTPAYNVASYIGAAITSVLAQTHADWVMTIVDDGSTDPTHAIAAAFRDPRIRLIRQTNAGVSAARNRGMVAPDADALIFLDADDWLSPEALCRLAACLEATPAAVAASGPYIRVTEAGQPFGSVKWPPAGDLSKKILIRNLFINGGHLLIRGTSLTRAGLFRTDLTYGEDWEYWTRLAQFGPFAAVGTATPLLFARERHNGAYLTHAAEPQSFEPCMNAIFTSSVLHERWSPEAIQRLRKGASAENDWIVGRELIRHGRTTEGRAFLCRSLRVAPNLKRLIMLGAARFPAARIGPFRRYDPSPTFPS